MVNTKMFYHPNYYKNLRKLARLRNRDQVISGANATAKVERAPGTGLKQQAIEETVPYNDIEEAKASSSQAGGRVGPKGSSLQAGERASAQASSGARINKR